MDILDFLFCNSKCNRKCTKLFHSANNFHFWLSLVVILEWRIVKKQYKIITKLNCFSPPTAGYAFLQQQKKNITPKAQHCSMFNWKSHKTHWLPFELLSVFANICWLLIIYHFVSTKQPRLYFGFVRCFIQSQSREWFLIFHCIYLIIKLPTKLHIFPLIIFPSCNLT